MNPKNTWAVVIAEPNMKDPQWSGVLLTETHSAPVWDRNGNSQYDAKEEAEERVVQVATYSHYNLRVEKYCPRKYAEGGYNAPRRIP